jgi:hypothetical protein
MVENAGAKEQSFIIWMGRDEYRPACMAKCIRNEAWVIGQIVGKREIQKERPYYDHADQGG